MRDDLDYILDLFGGPQFPLYMGVAGLLAAAVIVFIVPRSNGWRGPVAGFAGLLSLILPIGIVWGLVDQLEEQFGEAIKLLHAGSWAVIAICIVVAITCFTSVRR